jgi:hypothetical protein
VTEPTPRRNRFPLCWTAPDFIPETGERILRSPYQRNQLRLSSIAMDYSARVGVAPHDDAGIVKTTRPGLE